jgi:hypothetical protein
VSERELGGVGVGVGVVVIYFIYFKRNSIFNSIIFQGNILGIVSQVEDVEWEREDPHGKGCWIMEWVGMNNKSSY